MTVRIGTNPIAWSNDDKRELGASISLETCLSQARAAGFRGIELGHKFPRRSETLGPILAGHGIELIGGWYSTQLLARTVEEEVAALQDHMTLLLDMGCDVFIWAETSGAVHGDERRALSDRPHMSEDDWETFTDRGNLLCAYLRDRGLAPAFHHHMGTVLETEAEVDRFMNATGDHVGLLLDAGHATYAGANPVELARRYGRRITHVHCKDVRMDVKTHAVAEDSSFLDAVVQGVFTVPGDGDVDFPELLRELKAQEYRGWLVVEAEQDPSVADPAFYANLGYRNLAAMCRDAGMIKE